jgi:hypothetical protein
MIPFALACVRQVTFYKRDELTTDLICCDVVADDAAGAVTWFCHEDASEWREWLDNLESLDGFDPDWFSRVSQPPFGSCETIAYVRPGLLEPTAAKD